MSTLVTLTCETGLKKRELLDLRWEDIRIDRRQLTVQRVSREQRRTVDLTDEAVRALECHERFYRRATTSLVFPAFAKDTNGAAHPTNITIAWSSVRKKAGLKGLQFDMLRYEYGQRLADGGKTQLEVAQALGFRSTYAVTKFFTKRERPSKCQTA